MASMNDITGMTGDNAALQRRAEFRATLAIEGSVAEAGRMLARTSGDAQAACEEMLREHLTLSFFSTQAALDVTFGPEAVEEARERTRIALGLQRASILMRRSRLLQALAEKDDVLTYEMAEDERALTDESLSAESREETLANLKVAKVCRADLAALARVVIEQQAMREVMAEQGIRSFDAETLEVLAQAAEQRSAPVLPALERGVPLRRALAADLVTEGMVEAEAVARNVQPAAPKKGIAR